MFFLPLSDDNVTVRSVLVVWIVIAVCTAVFIWQSSLGRAPPKPQPCPSA